MMAGMASLFLFITVSPEFKTAFGIEQALSKHLMNEE
jgi:hypothetical protein